MAAIRRQQEVSTSESETSDSDEDTKIVTRAPAENTQKSHKDLAKSCSDLGTPRKKVQMQLDPALIKDYEAISRPGILKVDDIEEDDEIWMIRVPLAIDLGKLQNSTFNFSKTSKTSFNLPSGKKYEYSFLPNKIEVACLLPSLEGNELQMVPLKTAGSMEITESVSVSPVKYMEVPEDDITTLPEGLKIRHPIYGLHYEAAVSGLRNKKTRKRKLNRDESDSSPKKKKNKMSCYSELENELQGNSEDSDNKHCHENVMKGKKSKSEKTVLEKEDKSWKKMSMVEENSGQIEDKEGRRQQRRLTFKKEHSEKKKKRKSIVKMEYPEEAIEEEEQIDIGYLEKYKRKSHIEEETMESVVSTRKQKRKFRDTEEEPVKENKRKREDTSNESVELQEQELVKKRKKKGKNGIQQVIKKKQSPIKVKKEKREQLESTLEKLAKVEVKIEQEEEKRKAIRKAKRKQ